MLQVKVKRILPHALLPSYATPGSNCFDIRAYCPDVEHYTRKGFCTKIRTGLAFEIPPGHCMLVFSRSGHAVQTLTRLANCVGVIDSDYRGELIIPMTSDGAGACIMHGDRIAQGMVIPVPTVEFEAVNELSPTERGAGGFGSTGNA